MKPSLQALNVYHGMMVDKKTTSKRWTLEELQERWDGFWYVRDQDDPKWDTDSRINIAFAKFIDWLSAET